MKRIIFLLSILCCNGAYADTINLHWLNEDRTTYQDSTCVIDSDLILPATPPTKYGYTFTGWKISNYIPIEYLEGTNNNQYIDTGVIPNANMSLHIKFSLVTNTYPNTMPFGARNTYGGQDGVTLFMDNSNGIVADWFNGTVNTRWFTNIKPKTDIIYEASVSNSLMTIKENSIVTATHQFIPQSTNTKNLYINALNDGGFLSSNRYNIIKIYEFAIDGVIDLIPVIDYNGVPCMFDRVKGNFYYNQGTGQFIAGPALQ